MESITFATPTLAAAAMSRQDQIDIVVNQAVAAVVCCYLEHMNAVIAAVPPNMNVSQLQVITQPELISLINDVQTALRSVP